MHKNAFKLLLLVLAGSQPAVGQVIATRLVLGSGGRKYFLAFYSGNKREVSDFELTIIHQPNDTDDQDRIRFRKILEVGLLHYLSETPQIDQFDISFNGEKDEGSQMTAPALDPWHFRVFHLTGTSGRDLEESKKSISLSGSVQTDRITDKCLLQNTLSYKTTNRTYLSGDNDVYKSLNLEAYIDTRTVYAFTDHLSVGLFGKASHSTYINTDLGLYLKPAIENNFFDWKEANQRIFTASYFVGPAYYQYRDSTFLNHMTDMLWEHNLQVGLELVQPWGEVGIRLYFGSLYNNIVNERF